MRYPFNNSYPLTSPFGMRDNPFATGGREFHDGVDFGCPANTPILAATDGTITLATFSTLWGNYVELTESSKIITKYTHLNAFNVSIGQQVKQGEIIGWSGSTGRSTGAHLHFGVAERGVFVDPLIHLNNNIMSLDKNTIYTTIDNDQNFDEPTKQTLKNAVNNNDMNYILAFAGSQPRRFLNEANLEKYKAEEKLSQIDEINKKTIEGMQEIIDSGNAITAQYAQKIVDIGKDAKQAETILNEQKAENLELQTQIKKLKLANSINQVPDVGNTSGKSNSSTNDKWDWNKFFVGLSKNATIQSVLGVIITAGISWITTQIPELKPLQTEITVGLLGLLGVGVAGQNVSNVIKTNQ